jgi:type I restriction enzyme S subunit
MNKGWAWKKVCKIAQHSLGKMLDKAKNKGEPKPYLRNFNVRWFGFDLSDVSEMRFLPEELDKYTAIKGDILICEGGYPGRAAIWEKEEPIYFQKALHRVRFHEPERSKWFLYYLYAKDIDGTLKSHFNGAGIQHFTGEALAQFEVPLPPLPEQERIVGILDEAFEGIATAKANAERNLQNARVLFESHLQSVFSQRGKGWVETTLGAEIDLLSGFPFKSARYTESEKDVRLLRGDNIVQGSLRWDDVKRWPASDTAEYERYQLSAGDVVLAMDRPWVKAGLKRAQISREDLPCLLVQRTARLRGNCSLNNRFLVYLISSGAFTRHILGVQTGIGVPHISGQQIKDFGFLKPPVEQQIHIADNLDELSTETQRLASIYERKLAALEALKKSLLHQAFTGKL